MTHGHESDHEQATIERLQLLGYEYLPGPEHLSDETLLEQAEKAVEGAV